MSRSFTLAEYEACVKNTATLVVKFGEAAIPLLERAEAELASAQTRGSALSRAQAILRSA